MPAASTIIPSDSPSLFEALQTLQTTSPAAYNAIVRPNNPPPGVGGFLFDIPGDEEVRLRSAISRHYVESNIPISDHIALEPETVILRGLVAELTSGLPATPAPATVNNPLPLLAPMTPQLTPGQAQAAALTVSKSAVAASGATSIYGYYQNYQGLGQNGRKNTKGTRQTAAFLYFQQLWWGRQIVSVETPWGIYTNMAIADVRSVQTKETKYLSDFTVTFERIRVTGDITITAGQLAGRNVSQQAAATPTQNGALGQVAPSATQLSAAYSFTPSSN